MRVFGEDEGSVKGESEGESTGEGSSVKVRVRLV